MPRSVLLLAVAVAVVCLGTTGVQATISVAYGPPNPAYKQCQLKCGMEFDDCMHSWQWLKYANYPYCKNEREECERGCPAPFFPYATDAAKSSVSVGVAVEAPAALVGGVPCNQCESQYYDCRARMSAEKQKTCFDMELQCRRTCRLGEAESDVSAAVSSYGACESCITRCKRDLGCIFTCRSICPQGVSGTQAFGRA